MGTRGNSGGGSASRVGDYDVDLSDRWDWSSIPRLLSSACLFFCSGWVPLPSRLSRRLRSILFLSVGYDARREIR
ncbi:hypothetical protein PR202_gb26284 [Eleusine coracana subsp. coracana]|uniref:Uncharacterized protein n=1 Tax=Eleusine coracana subsp. coracana TaxID=191504 RepID=A0AAV5FRG5_ELECO|nr:hypothetical protein PR202_gb26284 [Eleusine coracana subsp. coracana]